jgi:predicted O-methyltransferase YrrM
MTATRAFPDSDLKVDGPNLATVAFFAGTGCRSFAEIGVYRGDTALAVAELLGGRGQIHLFDYADRVAGAEARLRAAGHANVTAHPNSRRLLDSYNWSLMRVLREADSPVFDYVFIDGAHTWAHDALAFLLIDRLLSPGGYVDFDDYRWSLRTSPSMNPQAFPDVEELYTGEQIDSHQVALVVDLLLRRSDGYEEVVENKVFRKQAGSS